MIQDNAPDFSKYVGIPYRSPDSGNDGLHCWELVELVMLEAYGLKPPHIEYNGPTREVVPVFMSNLKKWKPIDPEDRRGGDVAILTVYGQPAHCGVLISRNEMIHTMKECNSVIEKIDSLKWMSRLVGVYRYVPGAEKKCS